jgi:hypothetical protein
MLAPKLYYGRSNPTIMVPLPPLHDLSARLYTCLAATVQIQVGIKG